VIQYSFVKGKKRSLALRTSIGGVGECSTHGRKEMLRKSWLENLTGRNHSDGLGVGGRIVLEWILERWGGGLRIGFVWLGMVTGGGLLWAWR
jgi:hypothetical protein